METNAEKKIEAQKRLREELELELEKFRRYCSAQEKEIEMLRNELQNHGISIGKRDGWHSFLFGVCYSYFAVYSKNY